MTLSRLWLVVAIATISILFGVVIPTLGFEVEDEVNLFVNPGIESVADGEPSGWIRYNAPNTSYGPAATVSTDARSGNTSLLIDADEAKLHLPDGTRVRQSWRQNFALDTEGTVPGELHTLSFYYKTVGESRLQLKIERYHKANGSDHSTGIYPSTDTWTYVEHDFVWPDPEEYERQVHVHFFINSSDGGKVWIDDVALKPPTKTEREVGVFYISPDGSDSQAGTKDNPWATLSKVSREAKAGDTFVFLPGEYEGVLQPTTSGTADAPITFRAVKRRESRLVGTSGAHHAINLNGVEYIRLEGLHVRPDSPQGRWFIAQNTKHIYLTDMLMEKAHGSMPFLISDSEHVYVQDNVIREYTGGNMGQIGNSRHILFEGNAVSRAGHSPMRFAPDQSNQYLVIRGNVFHPTWGRAFSISTPRDFLFEGNVLTHALNGGRSNAAASNFHGERVIFRFNRFFRNWGAPTQTRPWLETNPFVDARIYNNVFDHNHEEGLRLLTQSTAAPMEDNIVINNIFTRNDPYGEDRQIVFSAGANHVRFIRNVIEGTVAVAGTEARQLSHVQSEGWNETYGNQFQDNVHVDPSFVSKELYDHRLEPTSPLRNMAAPLTKTVRSGEGDILPVEDTLYFYDGFGIVGEKGDLIAVGDERRVARVVHVDLESGTLLLDRSISWERDEPVSLAWVGEGPDMGAYEHGDYGRVSVAIVADPFFVRPGDEVRLRAHVYGDAEPISYTWQLGDGTLAHGPEVNHRYDFTLEHVNSPGGFPVRVRVHTADGGSYVGATLIEHADFADAEIPLLHTTFDADDADWWWHWKTYRPEPTDWERQVDRLTGEGVIRISNPGGGTLPFKTSPALWDIDEYPWVYLRYRIQPGVPVGVYLEGFRKEGEARRMWVAIPPGSVNRQLSQATPYRLFDDDEWHTLLIDARVIREAYLDIVNLKSVGIERISVAGLGATYWIDEVAILSSEAARTSVWQSKLASRQWGHIQISSPIKGTVVTGNIAINLEFERYKDVNGDPLFTCVREFDLTMNGETLFKGNQLNEMKDLVIDTTQWADGRYELTAKLTDDRGRILERVVSFAIRNREVMVDDLNPPEQRSILGAIITVDHTKTIIESSGWEYAPEEEPLFHDKGRKVKATDREEYLIWDAPELRGFLVTMYAQSDDVTRAVRLETRVGEGTWVRLPYEIEVSDVDAQGWIKYVLSGVAPGDLNTKAFKITLDDAIPARKYQLGQVTLDIRSVDGVINLLPNPTWEGAPDMPIGWRMHNSRSELNDTVLFIPDADSSGSWLVKIDDPDGNAYGFKSAALPVQEGATYTATVMARVGDPDDPESIPGRASLYLEYFDEQGRQMDAEAFHHTDTTWGRNTITRPAPKGAVSVGVMLYSSSGIVGESYFKDVRLEIAE